MSDFDPRKVLEDAARAVAASVNQLVPPEAQRHLLAAQRELLLALAAGLKHNADRSAPSDVKAKKRSRPRKPTRVDVN